MARAQHSHDGHRATRLESETHLPWRGVQNACRTTGMETGTEDPLAFLVELSPKELADGLLGEDDALRFLESRRWPLGISCPDCNSDSTYSIGGSLSRSRHLHGCRGCNRQFSWRSGSIFKGTRNSPLVILTAAEALSSGHASADVVRLLEQGFDFRRPRAQRLVTELMELSLASQAGVELVLADSDANPEDLVRPATEGPAVAAVAVSKEPGFTESAQPAEADSSTEPLELPAMAQAEKIETSKSVGSLLFMFALVLLGATAFVSLRGNAVEAAAPETWTRSWKVGNDRFDVTSKRKAGESKEDWVQRFDAELRELEDEFPPNKEPQDAGTRDDL